MASPPPSPTPSPVVMEEDEAMLNSTRLLLDGLLEDDMYDCKQNDVIITSCYRECMLHAYKCYTRTCIYICRYMYIHVHCLLASEASLLSCTNGMIFLYICMSLVLHIP